MGNDAIVGNPNSASLCLRGTGKREGGKKTQPLEDFNSHPFILNRFRFTLGPSSDASHALDIPSGVGMEFCPEMVGMAHPCLPAVAKITSTILTLLQMDACMHKCSHLEHIWSSICKTGKIALSKCPF